MRFSVSLCSCLCLIVLVCGPMQQVPLQAADKFDVLRPQNQVAWCIVPFDAKKRGPAQRAEMLKQLGMTRCAYDWRPQHVAEFEQEILEYKRHGIEFFAFWSVHEDAFRLFEKHDLHPQIWQTLADPGGTDQQEKVKTAAQRLLPLAQRTQALGCSLGLYNHGGWGGEPANMVAVCQRLREQGFGHVGLVYNFHHGHDHISNWAASFALMQPYLLCLNLNGMQSRPDPKILGIGKGAHELQMIRTVVERGYAGPIGILDHREQLDAKESLKENIDGLAWLTRELRQPGSGGALPETPMPPAADHSKSVSATNSGHLFPGQDAYRQPPLTVELKAKLRRRDGYNILVACDSKSSADHWEVFSMAGSGHLTAYLPGCDPDHVRSNVQICDDRSHTIAMIYEADRVRLFVDGRMVANTKIRRLNNKAAMPGMLGIGRLTEGTLGCDGTIEWLRISKGVREVSATPNAKVERDSQTVGFWNFADTHAHSKHDSTEHPPAPAVMQAEPPYDAALAEQLLADSQKHGDALRGATVFAAARFACLSCHQVGTVGGKVGPALSTLAKDRNLQHIVESVLWPRRDVKPEYMTHQVVLSSGRILTGYLASSNEAEIVLRDPASGQLTSIARTDIEELVAGSTVMPSGLTVNMTRQQQLDLLRFLSDLGRDGQPLSESLLDTLQHSQSHAPAEFPIVAAPVDPERWPGATHFVNRDRLYDFYTRQAEHFRKQHLTPMLLAPYPGLDGGQQGHWGNQNEQVWADDRWNDTQLGTVQCGVLRAAGKTVARGICIKLGDNHELSACFNPDTLTYDVIWSEGFVKFDSVRHGFVGGLKPEGQLHAVPEQKAPEQPFTYHGFYRHGNRILFSYRIGEIDYLDAPWVEDGELVRDVRPADQHPLRHLTSGGPTVWPDLLETEIIPGQGKGYAVDTITLPYKNPWNSLLFCGGHDFLPDGTALVCTIQGDVWHVSGLSTTNQAADSDQTSISAAEPAFGKARWRRFASGLHHALGLLVSDGQVYVQCRDQLVRLHDLNDDGEADFYECFSNAFQTSPAGHDFICGLQRDSRGNFYTASGNQGLVKISADGRQADVIATGFRNPDGLGILPGDLLTVPVSEGEWTPASAINAFSSHLQKSAAAAQAPLHFGYRGPRNGQPPSLPLVYLPRGLDNSSGGQTWIDSERFGPLNQQLIHLSFGAASWFAVLRDEVHGQLQGAVAPMTGDFLSGVHRARCSPADGQLYVSGMAGWGAYTREDGCFQRVRYTGDEVQVPVGFHVHKNGIRITFHQPLDAAVATDTTQHFAQCWNYRYTGAYGSPEYSTTHPGVPGHDPLTIRSAHVLSDGRSLFLEIPDLQPVNQLHLRMHVNSEEVVSCNPTGTGHDLFVTVHQLDAAFSEFPGYQPEPKVIAAHPLLSDLATNATRAPNPFQKELADAREIEIQTGKNLTYTTSEVTVAAGESLQFTLINPDVVPHNWVLVQSRALREVGELSNQLIASPDAYAKQYIPDSDRVLAYTDIVSPGSRQTIYFRAPAAPGRYPFLCTFPGHWMVMNGTLVVEPR